MTMLLTITFAKPLDRAGRTSVQLAMAGLAKAKAVWIDRRGWSATVAGEGLGTTAVQAALGAAGIPVVRVETSLAPEEDARCEDAGTAGERVRALGR
jgi:hypothetical protein